jgi:hypothetical protein
MNQDLNKTPDTSGYKKEFRIEGSEPAETSKSVGGGDTGAYDKKGSIDVAVAQLSEKVNALDEKVKGALESRKWILFSTLAVAGFLLTAIGIVIGAVTIVYNSNKDSQDAYRNLQDTYYQELIDLRKEVNRDVIVPIPPKGQ